MQLFGYWHNPPLSWKLISLFSFIPVQILMDRGTACGINRDTTNDFSETALCYVLVFLLFILRYFPQPFQGNRSRQYRANKPVFQIVARWLIEYVARRNRQGARCFHQPEAYPLRIRAVHYRPRNGTSIIHGFPDWFRFHATKWHGALQIGNAVPPPLARSIATAVPKALGVGPTGAERTLELGDPSLLCMEMSEAADHFGVEPPIGRPDRKSGARKREQHEIEAAHNQSSVVRG